MFQDVLENNYQVSIREPQHLIQYFNPFWSMQLECMPWVNVGDDAYMLPK